MSAIRRLLAAIDAHPQQTITVRVGTQWEPRPYALLSADVAAAAALLREIGIAEGHRVGLLGENSYEWVVYDLACMAVGAVSVGLLEDDLITGTVDDLVARFGLAAVAADPRHVVEHPGDVVASSLGAQPASLRLIGFPDRPRDRPAMTHEEPGDVFTLVFSSGTSGRVKCLRIGGAGVLAAVDAFAEAFAFGGPDDCMLVGLPLSSFQQRLMMYCAFATGAGVMLAVPKRMFSALASDRPTVAVAPPQFYHGIEQRFGARPAEDRAAALARADELAGLPDDERRAALRELFPEAYGMIGPRARVLITGAAPTRRSALELLARMGVPLYEAYSSNEGGVIAWNRPGCQRIGTVGQPAHGPGSVRTDDGTITVRPPRPFCWGYEPGHGDTAAVFDEEGGVHTGDRGQIDADGFVSIDGRVDDVLVTTGGQKIDPVLVELAIDKVAGTGHPVLFAHQGGGTQLLMCVGAGDRGRIEAAVDEAVAGLNAQLPTAARIQRVVWEDLELTEEGGFLTRNRKINRSAVRAHFAGALGLAHPVTKEIA
ncbi:MAG TPA: AMP-binding protein [Iamia sp.]|nr:AMP-binding protein [Iamia sp.]